MMEDDNAWQMPANIKLVDRNPFIPSLRTLALQLCVLNANNFVSMGDLPLVLIEPILQACSAAQLARLEDESPHLRAETDTMWARHVRERFRVAFEKKQGEGWRDVYERLKLEEGERLKMATARLAAKNGRIEKEKLAKQIVVIEPPLGPRKKRSNPFGGKFSLSWIEYLTKLGHGAGPQKRNPIMEKAKRQTSTTKSNYASAPRFGLTTTVSSSPQSKQGISRAPAQKRPPAPPNDNNIFGKPVEMQKV